MERPVLVRHAELVLKHLPPGFRFHPTDEELVVQYLRRKALSSPLPAAVIPDILDLCNFDPWNLPGANEGDNKYFFTMQGVVSNKKGSRCRRAAGSGYWKAMGKEKPILASKCSSKNRSSELVGVKRALVFHHGKSPRASRRTDWIMHEFRLIATTEQNNASHNCFTQPKEWVVCRIFRKNRLRRSDGEVRQMPGNNASIGHHTLQPQENASFLQPSSSLSSSLSCVTNILDQEEVSSGNIDAADASLREA